MDITHALKDLYYRRALEVGELEHPAGDVALSPLSDADLTDAVGAGTGQIGTVGCCNQPTTAWQWTTPSLPIPTVSVGCALTFFSCH
jgi:hypothetical protein